MYKFVPKTPKRQNRPPLNLCASSKSFPSLHPAEKRASLEKVEQPVASVEQQEGDRKHDPRVLVDDVDVLDLRHGGLEHQGAAPDGVQHLGSVHRVAWNEFG